MTGQSIEREFQVRAAEQSRKNERNRFEQSLATDGDAARQTIPNDYSFVHRVAAYFTALRSSGPAARIPAGH